MTEKKKHKKADEPIDEKHTVQKALGVASAAEITFTPVKRKDSALVTKQKQEVLQSNAFLADDEFGSLSDNLRATIIAPPFSPRFLVHLCLHNNALMQAVAAMELNIDGTGHTLKEKDKKDEEEEDKEALRKGNSIFKEPWPGMSFVTLRRQKRRDEEITGNAYFEVLRTLEGKIAFMRNLDATTIRMVRLDEPTERVFEVERDGKMIPLTMSIRERRFAQAVPKTFSTVAGTDPTRDRKVDLIYFKEFGASRDLDKTTGKWAPKNSLAGNLKATELIHFTVNKTAGTPYGMPRWINQTPSVLGSRKAEELNIDFFNAGGLPPAMIIISGGQLTEPVRQQVQNYLSGKGASKHRAAIIEAHSTGGSMEGGGSSVSVRVERFGSEKQKDSLFENYDERCEKRVRSSFRLPPLFVGRTEDFNFASANVSYLVAEAQVFGPERVEFDERVNTTIMKEVNPDLEFKSNPITLKDVTNQIKAITLASKGTSAIGNENLVKMLNLVTNLELEAVAPEEVTRRRRRLPVAPAPGVGPAAEARRPGGQPPPGQQPAPNQDGGEPPARRAAKAWSEKLIDVAQTWAGIHTGAIEISEADKQVLDTAIKMLDENSRRLFDHVVAIQMLAGYGFDPEGAEELTAAACEILGGGKA